MRKETIMVTIMSPEPGDELPKNATGRKSWKCFNVSPDFSLTFSKEKKKKIITCAQEKIAFGN
jgi:hypothetical protein